jgi:hypothetical protein
MNAIARILIPFPFILGLFMGPCNAMEQNNIMTDNTIFARNQLDDWGFYNVRVVNDANKFNSHAGDSSIYLGTEWEFFANNPEILTAILAHEIMHIMHKDTWFFNLTGTSLYAWYRAATAFFSTQAFNAVVNVFFPEDWGENDIGSWIKTLGLFVIPLITLYRSSTTAFSGHTFSLPTCPCGTTIFLTIYALLSIVNNQCSENDLDTFSAFVQKVFGLTNTVLQTILNVGIKILFPVLMYFLMRNGSLYLYRAFQRSAETWADRESVIRFGTGQGMIAFLRSISALIPTENVESWLKAHPTPTQRIATLEALTNGNS